MNKEESVTADVPCVNEPPDFDNLLAVLSRSRPRRATLFEFFLNGPLYEKLAGGTPASQNGTPDHLTIIRAFRNAGYDYATVGVPGFIFEAGETRRESTQSLNEGCVIVDRSAFDSYQWPDPDDAQCDYAILDRLAGHLPPGMKLIVNGPGGVLENIIKLVGYDNLCYMTADDEKLASDIFEAVGSRLVKYYERCVGYPAVGAIIGNDDWGFKSQTMLPPDQMRRFVFPWHTEIVRAAHAAGKPAILHSCGQIRAVMEDVIEEMKYDARHSYEDVIQPVESAYDEYHERIAVLGGIDMDFICRSTPEEVYKRSAEMLERSQTRGAYALGTGNSVPAYVPDDNYFAMIRAALDLRR